MPASVVSYICYDAIAAAFGRRRDSVGALVVGKDWGQACGGKGGACRGNGVGEWPWHPGQRVPGVGLAVEGHRHLSHLTEQSVGGVVGRASKLPSKQASKGGRPGGIRQNGNHSSGCVCMAGVRRAANLLPASFVAMPSKIIGLCLGRAAETPVSSNRYMRARKQEEAERNRTWSSRLAKLLASSRNYSIHDELMPRSLLCVKCICV